MDKIKRILPHVRQSVVVTLVLMLVCGLLFPLLLQGLSHVFFKNQANGSLIEVNGHVIGSEYVGQEFTKDYFMKGRPSAVHYNTYKEDENGKKTLSDGSEFGGVSSGSQNLAASNPELKKRVEKDLEKFLKENPEIKAEQIPTDLLTASGSGLDPHISPESARVQIPAIAKASGLSEEKLEEIVKKNTKGKLLGFLGEETVNVLLVNLDIATEMGLIK